MMALARASRSAISGNKENPGKHVAVRCGCKADEVSIAVRDEGRGFDIIKMPDPTTLENRGLSQGRGIYLMKALMDEVSFEEGGVLVHMRKRAGHDTAKDAGKNPPE